MLKGRAADAGGFWLGSSLLLALLMLAVCSGAWARETVTPTRASVADPPGNSADLAFGSTITSTPGSTPSAITSIDLLAPSGTTLDLDHTAVCSQPALEALGPEGCPRSARAGYGSGLAVSRIAGKLVEEPFTLQLFIAEQAPRGRGLLGLLSEHEPFAIEATFAGTFRAAARPYGLDVELDIPVISVYPGAIPEASTQSIRITLGENPAHDGGLGFSLPHACPHGGWPLASRFTFQDATSAVWTHRAPCRGA